MLQEIAAERVRSGLDGEYVALRSSCRHRPAHWLGHARFRGAFERVVFAVYDRAVGQPSLTAFRDTAFRDRFSD